MIVDGGIYMDGGVLGALPVWAAVECGATSLIALDALPEMPSRIVRTAARCAAALSASRREACIPVQKIARKLGSLEDAMHWKSRTPGAGSNWVNRMPPNWQCGLQASVLSH